MTKSQRTRPNDAVVSIEDPDEHAVRDAVRAVQTDLQHLLQQHFSDVKNVLKPLVKECVEQARSESVRSAQPPQVPMTPPIYVPPPAPIARPSHRTQPEETETSASRKPTIAAFPTYGIVGGIALIVALAAALTWAFMRDTPAPSRTRGAPAPPPPTPVAETLSPAQVAQTNFHRALARWGAGYRARDLNQALVSHLIPSADGISGERLNVDAEVVKAARLYLKDPTLTTHAQEALLAIALAQVAVSPSNGKPLDIDGSMTWPQIDQPGGSTAPLISEAFAKIYLRPGALTFLDLCGAATGPDCARMIPQVPLALAAERMLAP